MALAAGLGVAAGAGAEAVREMHGAHGGEGMHGAGGPFALAEGVSWLVDGALDDVQATNEQRARVLAVKERILASAKALHDGHEATHAEFFRQWTSGTVDKKVLYAQVDARVEELRATLHIAVDGLTEIHDTLTPDQRQRLTDKLSAMHGGH